MVLINSKRALDWSTARLCSVRHIMSTCILIRLSNTCLNCSYWSYGLILLILMKYNLVVLMCLVEGTISPMNSLSEGWSTKEVCMALFFIGIAFRVKVGGSEVCVCCDGCVCCGLLSEDALSC